MAFGGRGHCANRHKQISTAASYFCAKRRRSHKSSFSFAERQGFEPWVPKRHNGFRDRPIRPLWHLSLRRNPKAAQRYDYFCTFQLQLLFNSCTCAAANRLIGSRVKGCAAEAFACLGTLLSARLPSLLSPQVSLFSQPIN